MHATATFRIRHTRSSPRRARARPPEQLINEYAHGSSSIYKRDWKGEWKETRSAAAPTALDGLQGFFIPSGYPDAITPDYVSYQLWTLPVHVSGWASTSLVTSSLLKAAGIGSGAIGAVAAGATIKWIAKDGIGALGRYVVGGSLSRFFDEDPRFWRFLADLIVTAGLGLEICTAGSPSLFLLLAGGGNLAKAAGKGIGRPAFRVIQNHFATAANVGDVAAKEEVWEVTAQLFGLAFSVAVLQFLEAQPGDPVALVVGAWCCTQAVHVTLRYRALSTLQLPWLSQKRATLLAEAFVNSHPLPSVPELCRREAFVVPKMFLPCSVLVNCSMQQLLSAAQLLQLGRHWEAIEPRLAACGGVGASNDFDAAPGVLATVSSGDTASALNVPIAADSHAPRQIVSLEAESHPAFAAASSSASPLEAEYEPLLVALAVYEAEKYVLLPSRSFLPGTMHSKHSAVAGVPFAWMDSRPQFVLGLKPDATGIDKLQAILQAAKYQALMRAFPKRAAGQGDEEVSALMTSLVFARESIGSFTSELVERGWNTQAIIMWSSQKNVLDSKPL